jgi:hypothetical protein
MQLISQTQFVVQSHKDQNEVGTSVIPKQSHEISSLELVTNKRKDVIRCIQFKFVYQYASLDYCEQMEPWKVDEKTNVDVFEKIEENYPRSSKYAEV